MAVSNQKEIEGKEGKRIYSFGFMPPVDSIPVQIAVVKVIGEPLFAAFIGNGKEETPEAKTLLDQTSATAIGLMLSKMDAKDVVATMETVFAYVNVDGRKLNMNADFSGGRNKEMWTVFIHALRYNFQDFLEGSLLTFGQNKVQTSS